jgi:hypothetical protein
MTRILAPLLATALGACSSSRAPDPVPVDEPPSTSEPSSPAQLLARVTDAHGGVVEIYAPNAPDEINIAIGARYPSPPMVSSAFVKQHDPIEVYLAVAPLDAPVPKALRDAYPKLAVDESRRVALRETLAADLAMFPVFDVPLARTGACSDEFIAWFNAVYKAGPEAGEMCASGGDHPADYTLETADYYLDDGALPIVEDDLCSPYVLECDMWEATWRDWNWNTENKTGNGFAQKSDRHNMHTGMAQCAGNTTFYREWGSGSWSTNMGPGGGWHQFSGKFPHQLGPAVELAFGLWSTNAAPLAKARSELKNNTGHYDRVIWCGNFEDQWDVDDVGCQQWCDFDEPDACGDCLKVGP